MKNILKENPKVQELILEVAELAQYLWNYGWAERNAGNISVNINEICDADDVDFGDHPVYSLAEPFPELANCLFFVTGTGKRMRDLAREPLKNAALIKLSEQGDKYAIITQKKKNRYNFRPTSELPTHLSIHQMIARRGSDEKVIIHTHPNELVALTHSPLFKSAEALNTLLWGMHPEAFVFVPKGIGFVPYIVPGSQDIAKATVEQLKDHNVVMWEKHGIFSIGPEVFDTFDVIDILAKSARIYFMCKSGGFEPEGLNNEQLMELKAHFLK